MTMPVTKINTSDDIHPKVGILLKRECLGLLSGKEGVLEDGLDVLPENDVLSGCCIGMTVDVSFT